MKTQQHRRSCTRSRWRAGNALLSASIFCLSTLATGQLNQLPSSSPYQPQNAGTAAATDISGTVVDARNHSPIARALVRLGNRAVMTNRDGVFTFQQVSGTSAYFNVTKPGFYSTPDGDMGQQRSYRLPVVSPIEIPLYPEAILSGSVINQAGEGLPGLSVSAQRSVFDEMGHRWLQVGQMQTLSAGDFRFALPSGSYVLRINQRGRPVGGTEVILPLQVPAVGSANSQAVKLLSGEEIHLELRAELRRAYTVNLHFESEVRGFPILIAHMANGVSFPVSVSPSREQGDLRLALPAGTYTLFGSIQGPEGLVEGQTQITVTDHDVDGAVLRLSRAANLRVAVEADSSASFDHNAKLPEANQLGLIFQSSAQSTDGNSSTLHMMLQRGGQSSFAVPDGLYRLHAQAGGQWYVMSATCGGVDLLSQDIPISAGLDGTEIRVRVSNNTANLTGKVTVSGAPGGAWVYLLATEPSANPILILRANTDGTFFRPYLAPGGYRAVALERRINADLQDPATLSGYLDRVQSFTITPGEQHTLTLNAVTEAELGP